MVVEREFRNFEKFSAIEKLRQRSSSKIYLSLGPQKICINLVLTYIIIYNCQFALTQPQFYGRTFGRPNFSFFSASWQLRDFCYSSQIAQELGPKRDFVVLKLQVLPIDFYKHEKHDLFKKLQAFYGIFDKTTSNFNENFKLEFLVKFLIQLVF